MKTIALLVAVLFCSATKAQTFDEWFNQKSTQKKYLAQQIAALQVYIGYLQQGYKIAKKGLNTIGEIKNGHFKIDRDFFNRLSLVSPVVSGNPVVKQIVSMQQRSMVCLDSTNKICQSGLLTEKGGILNTIHNISQQVVSDREQLQMLLSGKLQMSDDERLKRMQELLKRTAAVLRVSEQLQNDVYILVIQKSSEREEYELLKKFYNPK